MSSIDERVASAVAAYGALTDLPQHAEVLARRYLHTLTNVSGEAPLEIGVRAGGTSAMFSELAAHAGPPGFMVISVDPWGCAPYMENGVDLSAVLAYDERFYTLARNLLARSPNNMLFRLDADTFLEHLLPNLRWWVDHTEHPRSAHFLSFVFLDGRHDSPSVLREVLRVCPHVVSGGCVVIDNADKCPEAVDIITRTMPALQAETLPGARLVLTVGARIIPCARL